MRKINNGYIKIMRLK